MRLLLALALVACANSEPPQKQVEGTPCSDLLPHFRAAALQIEPKAGFVFDNLQPQILGACLADHWPEPLRRCIVTASAAELAAHKCDALVPDELAQRLVDRLAPGRGLRASDFLVR